ncbi:CapA family protein [Enterococcus hulanensis]|uniref:CapA family protein n=1 Tax=Enterococcus hulanensis TaxID=2559929 RepID=UPI00288CCC31|nr:CapA family protein [Enterococcus hulanensis]MDT2662061.1 CapA family protein [Enterococcus hulanensis]
MEFSIDLLGDIKTEKEAKQLGDKGLGNLLILLLIFRNLENGNLLIEDTVIIPENISNEKKNPNCIGFDLDEEWMLTDLIKLQVITGAPDCALLLAKLFREKTKKSAQKEINALVVELGLTESCCKNISGRKKRNDPQSYTINDIKTIAKEFSKLSSKYQQYLTTSEISFKGRLYKNISKVFQEGKVVLGLFWDKKNGFLIREENVLVVLEADNEFELNDTFYLLLEDKEKPRKEKFKQKVFSKSNINVAILGDTYLGEWYAAHRKRLGRWDPIIDEGYDYSFESVKSLISGADFKIANFEAVLVKDLSSSPLKRVKKFVLGADIEETTAVLQRQSIDLVTLATNHIKDYGQDGVFQTIQALKDKKIAYIGCDETVAGAIAPFRLKTKTQEVFIFNAYWYKRYQYQVTDTYAIGESSGAACISNRFCEKISEVKQAHPNSKVIVIPHWGIDFRPIQAYQRENARRLVEAGADLIIGHGPHALQPAGKINDTDILYSIGNFVFNSDGEYKANPTALPYGAIVNLTFKGNSLHAHLKFIGTNNLKTKWVPKEVTIEEFQEITEAFKKEKCLDMGWEINEQEKEITKKIW